MFDPDRRVHLVKHTYGKFNWELPGGVSEKGEPADATVIPEVAEEARRIEARSMQPRSAPRACHCRHSVVVFKPSIRLDDGELL